MVSSTRETNRKYRSKSSLHRDARFDTAGELMEAVRERAHDEATADVVVKEILADESYVAGAFWYSRDHEWESIAAQAREAFNALRGALRQVDALVATSKDGSFALNRWIGTRSEFLFGLMKEQFGELLARDEFQDDHNWPEDDLDREEVIRRNPLLKSRQLALLTICCGAVPDVVRKASDIRALSPADVIKSEAANFDAARSRVKRAANLDTVRPRVSGGRNPATRASRRP